METILNQLPNSILLFDAQGQLLFLNSAARGLFFPQSENDSDENFTTLGWKSEQNTDWPLAQALRGEITANWEKRIVHPNGTYSDILVTVAPLRDNQQKIIGAVVTCADVTEQKQAEENIKRLNRDLEWRNAELNVECARWRTLIEGIADEVWVCDAEGNMSLINLGPVTAMELQEFTGKDVEEVLEEVDIFYLDGSLRPAEEAPLLRSLRGEIVRGEEIMRDRQTGRTRYRQFGKRSSA